MTLRPLTLFISVAALALLPGCTGQFSHHATASEVGPAAEAAAPPERPFPAETLYALLVAEMAGSRERYDIALGGYIQQAHLTRDPGVAARATRIARYLNAREAALDTSLLWVDINPDDLEARFTAATELAQDGQLSAALEHSNYLREHGSPPIYQAIAAKAASSTPQEREALLMEYQALQQKYPDDAEIFVGLGLLYQQQDRLDEALDAARQALRLEENLMPAIILETRLLTLMDRPDEALERVSALLKRNPDNDRLRLQYARLLASTDLEQAKAQFTELLLHNPNDPELIFSLGLVCLELGQLDEATAHFTALSAYNYHRSSGHYYLGRIAEQQQQWNEALHHYLQVEPGPDLLPATLQIADILVRGGQAAAAHKRLNALRKAFPHEAERFYLLEAEVLGKHLHLSDAQSLLTEGLQQFPNSPVLLYSRAMVNEKLDRLTEMEDDLRLILKSDPNNYDALNALGYTLADRTTRYDEAYALIERALQLSPDNPAILDSMGWVQYRMGNHKEALQKLRQAMDAYPDHEIAAHLGEVLWVSGKLDEARKIWQQGLKLHPDSRIIPAVMERLNAAGNNGQN